MYPFRPMYKPKRLVNSITYFLPVTTKNRHIITHRPTVKVVEEETATRELPFYLFRRK
jgi:hypothetical protein